MARQITKVVVLGTTSFMIYVDKVATTASQFGMTCVTQRIMTAPLYANSFESAFSDIIWYMVRMVALFNPWYRMMTIGEDSQAIGALDNSRRGSIGGGSACNK